MTYLYDGTFAGLLTVFHRLFSTGENPAAISAVEPCQSDLFDCVEKVAADPGRAWRLVEAMAGKISRLAVRNAHCAFLSEAPGIEMFLFGYLSLGREHGALLDDHLTHPDVVQVHRWASRVRTEIHRLKGFIRFREVDDGLLYAAVEPDFNILPLLAPYFALRLREERWLLHDCRRSQGILYEQGKWQAGNIHLDEVPRDASDEKELCRLWQRFFSEISVPERRNTALQKKFMPQRYWRHLTEMTGD